MVDPLVTRPGEVAVVGLGKSGAAAALLLARRGHDVYASDGGDSPALDAVGQTLRSAGIAVELGGHDLARLRKAALLVASPGIPPEAPPLGAARAAGVSIVGEIEIALRALPALRFIATAPGRDQTASIGRRARRNPQSSGWSAVQSQPASLSARRRLTGRSPRPRASRARGVAARKGGRITVPSL